jgi:hypothetical protein
VVFNQNREKLRVPQKFMTDLSLKQQSFVKNPLPNRLGKLAENLSQIQKLCAEESDQELILNLIKESRYFIEWTVPDLIQVDIEQAAELVNLGRGLTRWLFNWEKIWSNPQEKTHIAQQVEQWLKRVLEMSQLRRGAIAIKHFFIADKS